MEKKKIKFIAMIIIPIIILAFIGGICFQKLLSTPNTDSQIAEQVPSSILDDSSISDSVVDSTFDDENDSRIAELESELAKIDLDNNRSSNYLNISASVSPYGEGETNISLYEAPSNDSSVLNNIPFGSTVTILSVPDNYQDADSTHLALIEYNGQQGYVNTLSLLCDPNIDTSAYSQQQIFDMGKILFQECDFLSWMPVRVASLLNYTTSNEYDGNFQKMLPAGLTMAELHDRFYKYFSNSIVGFFEDSFQEKNGYLWQITGFGDRVWLDHYEVRDVKSYSDAEIVYIVDEYIDPNFYEFYPEQKYTFEFKLLHESGGWMLTIPDKSSETTSSEQIVSDDSSATGYSAIQGVVETKSSDLMLRRLPDSNDKTNVIAKIPKGTKITLLLPFKAYFADDDGGQAYWYYADYNGKTGFISAKYIKETNNRIKMTDEQITSVAKLLYLTAMNAESWLYSNCFDYSTENQIGCPDSYPHSNEFWYYPISDIRTTEDWYAQIHKQFSAKYDSNRNYGEGLEGLIISHDSYPPYYWNNNGQWYLLDAIFRKGDIPLDIAYSEPFKVVHLTKQSETENEIFFNGYLDFTNVQTEWLYDGGKENITGFSICFEDGRWKVGNY